MQKQKKENPFFEYFNRVLDIAYKYDITISLGDGLRPGSIFDANDKAQDSELFTLGKLARLAWKRSVQVIIEGPGHVRLDKIKDNVLLEKRVCRGAPFYVLGPLVTDIASGYDHISSAIGGAIAASAGADFLCFVTPSEHLRLPSVLVKGIKSALSWDKKMSVARGRRDWQRQIKLSMDPSKSAYYYGKTKKKSSNRVCRMCGEYCALKLGDESLRA